ncbi:MAG: phage/plasmid primase, P4 family [Oligoflexia bacterium]|nr:phage/plasmid primase, P4 family [Oligoflexia bacterium]
MNSNKSNNGQSKKDRVRLEPDLKQARRHLRSLDSRPDAKFTFQTFPDSKAKGAHGGLTAVLHGTLDEHADTLTRLNRLGAGIFVTVNETDGLGRKADNIIAVRAVFADKDNGPLPTLPIEATLIIESKNGDHAYWSVKSETAVDEFRKAQKAIIHKLSSDPKVCDPSRVMRLAGYFHLKDPHDPFLVRIKSRSNAKYTIEEIFAAFPQKVDKSKDKDDSGIAPSAGCEKFADWVSSLPIQEGGDNPLGGRNSTLLLLIREGLGCGISPDSIKTVAHDYCHRANEEIGIADEMLRRQTEQHRSSPFVSYFITPKKKYSAAEIADHYLVDRNLDDGTFLKLRFHKGDFYRYDENRYVKVSQSDLRANVVAFLRNSASTRKYAILSFANNVVANLEGKTLVPESVSIPSFLSQPDKQSARLISMRNGILDLEKAVSDNTDFLVPHTPDFFSTSCLPFDFDPEATCPTWIKVLKRVLPDRDLRRLLQEWFGYNLTFDTQHHKFVLFVGEGANGKSVVCTVLRSLLGRENFSAVGLEQFDPTRTFSLTAMVGRLANIVEEIGETDKVAEGVLKDLSAGGVMTVERKHKDAFEMKATARLTFATNVLPRFRDRTGALWRRMMPIPFKVQILNPAEQDKRLTDSSWWESSGELPGVLNWAIRGLVRLNENERFTAPKSSVELCKEYQAEANPAATFLDENCSLRSGKSISATHLYRRYSCWMESQNSKPLGQPQFSREVRKRFPDVLLSPNAKRQPDGMRAREWSGICLIDDEAKTFL